MSLTQNVWIPGYTKPELCFCTHFKFGLMKSIHFKLILINSKNVMFLKQQHFRSVQLHTITSEIATMTLPFPNYSLYLRAARSTDED